MNEPNTPDIDGIEYEDGEVILTEEAPDFLLERAEDDPELFQLVINYSMSQLAAGYKGEYLRLHEAKTLAESERAKMETAVEHGNIDAAQEHKSFAERFEQYHQNYVEIVSSNDE